MSKKRRHHTPKAPKKSRKMPTEVIAHFAAKTLETIRRRGITPKLMARKSRKRK